MSRGPSDRTLVVCAVLAALTLVVLTARGASGAEVGTVDPWDVGLFIALGAALASLLGLVLARTRSTGPPARPGASGSLTAASPETAAPELWPAQTKTRAVEEDEARQWESLLRFAQELSASPEIDRQHATISRRLPALLGSRDVWVVTRFGPRQHIIVPEGASGPGAGLLTNAQEWITFPLTDGGRTVGLLGIGLTRERMNDARRRIAAEVASLLARSLSTSDAFERMREASTVDALTGCSTRAEGVHRLEVELRRAQRSGKPVAVLLLDLDHFKRINDRYGHPCGDAVLALVGRTMMQTLRASDIRCRWGGEEFLLALPETSLEPAKTVADSVRRRIAEASISYAGEEVRVTASVGATVARPNETDIRNLLIRVDAALYRAKNEGRNCVRAVIGDLRGEPVATPPKPLPAIAFPERRDPSRPDRRRIPGPGRRRTDLSSYGHS